MKPVAALFDFDGVIVDSFNAHYGAWSEAFEELFTKKIAPFPHDTHSGKAPILIAEYFCERIGKKDRAMDLFKLKGEILHRGELVPELLPGVREIQKWLSENMIPYGIASNATKKFVGNSINQLDINYSIYFGLEDYVNPKPDPEPYLILAEALKISKSDLKNTWVFEDSLTGTSAAKAAGMIPIGIMTQYSESELKKKGSQMVFPTLLEAYHYLNSLKK